MSVATLPSAMCSAALMYARRGCPVFPCRERDETRAVAGGGGKTRTFKAKAPYTGQGLKDATTDENRIRAWWREHPDALIGLPTGANGCFVLDFDPRVEEMVDPDTGEVTGRQEWTLEQLKADLEAQMGCALPRSVTAVTQSGGVHVYFRQPDGEPIRNRGNLPDHVDVRGLGGYVIAPPSAMEDGARYRWLDRGDWRDDAAIAAAPAALVAILRAPKARVERPAPSPASGARSSPARVSAEVDDDVRRYGLSALDGECRAIRQAPSGKRNDQLNVSALKVARPGRCRRHRGDDRAVDDRGRGARQCRRRRRGAAARHDRQRLDRRDEQPARSHRDRGRRALPTGARPSPTILPSDPPPQSDDDGQPSSHEGGWASEIGRNGARGDAETVLTRECAFLPHTDLGNLQRFLKRHGGDFLFVEQWGWLAWDGRRWNRDMAVALLGRGVQNTMRAIQEEADLVRDSGIPAPALELWDAEQVRAHEVQQRGKFDRFVDVKKGILFSDTIAKWGRTSEGAGHIACIAKMAEARLSARPDDFDADPLLLNVENGTLVFARPANGRAASAELRRARRADRITKIAACGYDPGARSPRYDAFLEEVQPAADMRAFLDCWAGYNALGLADAQKMVLNYGQGANGKSVDTDVKAHILGDYARVCGIETFIDQGKYRKGSDASPDLAALAGRRMVRASEPEEGSKFSDGLIKAMTGSEPMPVRELMKPPFEMRVTFKVTVSANTKPKIGTDHGIQRRMQLVPWDVIIADDRQDAQLTGKLKEEASGILNRMVRGALAYLTDGLPMPDAIKAATREYQEENDILGQFLALCIVRQQGETMGASALHQLFSAWQTWAQLLPATGKPWSAKHLNAQMQRKGFTIRKSSSMVWDDIAAQYDPHDFVDGEGRPVTVALAPPRHSALVTPSYDDDDMPP